MIKVFFLVAFFCRVLVVPALFAALHRPTPQVATHAPYGPTEKSNDEPNETEPSHPPGLSIGAIACSPKSDCREAADCPTVAKYPKQFAHGAMVGYAGTDGVFVPLAAFPSLESAHKCAQDCAVVRDGLTGFCRD